MRRGAAIAVLFVLSAVLGGACKDPPPPDMPIGEELATLTPPAGTFDDILPAKGHYLYASSDDIHIFDVKNGTDAALVGVFPNARAIAVRGDLLYFSRDEGQGPFLMVGDISDPTTIKPIGTLLDPEIGLDMLRTMREAPTQTVVASKTIGPDDEVVLFDLLHPEKPEQVARFRTGYGAITSLAIEGDILYVAHDNPPEGTVQVWDVRDWDQPVELGRATGRCGTMFVATKGVVYCSFGSNVTAVNIPPRPVLDARDPRNPVFSVNDAAWSQVEVFVPIGPYLLAKQRIAEHPQGDRSGPAMYIELVSLFDIRDPVHPRGFRDDGTLLEAHRKRRAIAADDRFIYLTEGYVKIHARGRGARP